ncbi:hypothetical protein [Chitinimonas lacunae]|uniref:Uncharacterized protein n=1 Tax=Chitinimonas lacunae TaxID=1963018 RepID=A0ABV8MQN4_9NEIS
MTSYRLKSVLTLLALGLLSTNAGADGIATDGTAKPWPLQVESLQFARANASGFRNDSAAVASSVQSGAMAARNVNASAGAGIAGVVIGTLIVSAISRSGQDSEQLKPIKPLLDQVGTAALEKHIERWLRQHIPAMVQAQNSSSAVQGEISAAPTLVFDPSLKQVTLQLRLKIEPDGQRPLEEAFEAASRPIEGETVAPTYWSDNRSDKLYAEVDTLLKEVQRLFQQYHGKFPGELAKHQAIRYHNPIGAFYERGVVLASEADRIEYRSLGGVVKTVYGRLE